MSDFYGRVGIDAQAWAKEFCALMEGKTIQGNAPDSQDGTVVNVGTMIGWFANAIMAGWDAGHATGMRDKLHLFAKDLQREFQELTPN
jgi:hypothetical protein